MQHTTYCSEEDIRRGNVDSIKIDGQWLCEINATAADRNRFADILKERGLISEGFVSIPSGSFATIKNLFMLHETCDLEVIGKNVEFDWLASYFTLDNPRNDEEVQIEIVEVNGLPLGVAYDNKNIELLRKYEGDRFNKDYGIERAKLTAEFKSNLFNICGVADNPKAEALYQFIINLIDPQEFEKMEYEFREGVHLIKEEGY